MMSSSGHFLFREAEDLQRAYEFTFYVHSDPEYADHWRWLVIIEMADYEWCERMIYGE